MEALKGHRFTDFIEPIFSRSQLICHHHGITKHCFPHNSNITFIRSRANKTLFPQKHYRVISFCTAMPEKPERTDQQVTFLFIKRPDRLKQLKCRAISDNIHISVRHFKRVQHLPLSKTTPLIAGPIKVSLILLGTPALTSYEAQGDSMDIG